MSRLFRVAALSPHTMICSPSPVSTIVTGNPGRHEYRVGGLKLNLRAVVEMDGDAVVLSNRRDSAFLLSHCRSMPLGQSPPWRLRDVERRCATWRGGARSARATKSAQGHPHRVFQRLSGTCPWSLRRLVGIRGRGAGLRWA